MKEKFVVKQILDFLAAHRVFAVRLNTLAVTADYKGKRRMYRSHNLGPGTADIVVLPPGSLWIECKGTDGQQTEEQKLFAEWVKSYHHNYLLVSSIDDLDGLV